MSNTEPKTPFILYCLLALAASNAFSHRIRHQEIMAKLDEIAVISSKSLERKF